MPSKKKAKSDHKQQTLTSLFMKSQESDPPTQSDLHTDKNVETNEKSSASSVGLDSAPANLKSREFKSHWLQLFSWLTYKSEENYMYCTICTNAKQCNGMSQKAKCTNFQLATLRRHADLDGL